jgi:hypothetical protein
MMKDRYPEITALISKKIPDSASEEEKNRRIRLLKDIIWLQDWIILESVSRAIGIGCTAIGWCYGDKTTILTGIGAWIAALLFFCSSERLARIIKRRENV